MLFHDDLVQVRIEETEGGKSEETGNEIVEESFEGEEDWKTITPSNIPYASVSLSNHPYIMFLLVLAFGASQAITGTKKY